MNLLRSILATTQFEFSQSLSAQRLLVAAVLAGFPPAMITVIWQAGRRSGNVVPLDDLLIFILVSIVALLAQLLWATPNVYSELEAKSWIFVASRPGGRIALFLGKYLAAVFFGFSVCYVSVSACLVIRAIAMNTSVFPYTTWLGMNSTLLLACFSYSAIFSLIGTIFQKKAMVFAVAYVLLSEGIVANIPAIISRFTPRFHLQTIATKWIGWILPIPEEIYKQEFGDTSTLFHLLCLVPAIVMILICGCIVITSRQYITAEET